MTSLCPQQADDVVGRLRHRNAGGPKRLFLAFRRAPVAGDDCTRVTHPLALRRGAAGDESNGLQSGAFAEHLRCALLIRAADLADDHKVRGLRVVLEELDDVLECQAEHRVPADPNDGRLAHSSRGERRADLICQRAAARHQTDVAGTRDSLRDDADLGHAWRDQARAVRAQQSRPRVSVQEVLDLDHVLDRDAFGDTDDQLDSVGGRLHDGVRRKRWRHEYAGRVRARGADCLGDRVEDRHADVRGPSLARARASDQVGADLAHLFGVKCAFASGDALDDYARAGVQEDAHLVMEGCASPPPLRGTSPWDGEVTSTISLAASHALAPGSMPFCRRMARPSSSRVPLKRTTSGSFICSRSRAVTMPLATSSPRVMPPKTLIRTPLTRGFMRMTASAFSTTSAFAPPPMSQKLAARPPARCTRSSVLMHRPAPLPMMPMSPSRET